MSRYKFHLAGAVIALLIVANIINYLLSGWGLITVKVHDVPIGQVIKSIERQGWVTIYSNIDPQTRISMFVDHVPLPDAMETLAVNANAQWHLGFFVAPNSAAVKEEIRTFTEAADDDGDAQVYSFPTPLNMVADDSMPVADPSKQVWPGLQMPPAPPPDPNGPTANATPPATNPDGTPAPDPNAPPTSVQGYLRAFAREADVWIMAPSTWDPNVTTAPPPDPSISSAIRKFVSSAHGSMTQAFVLRGRPQRVAGDDRPRRGDGFRGGGLDFTMTEERVDNAINGLPAAYQPAARAQLAQEKQFQKEAANLPWDQRREMMRKHFMERRMDGDNNWRRSPEQRAKMFARLVSNRIAATGK